MIGKVRNSCNQCKVDSFGALCELDTSLIAIAETVQVPKVSLSNKHLMSETRRLKGFALPRHPKNVERSGALRSSKCSEYEIDSYYNTEKFAPQTFQEPTFKRTTREKSPNSDLYTELGAGRTSNPNLLKAYKVYKGGVAIPSKITAPVAR